MTGIDLTHGRGIPELMKLQENFKDYRIVVSGVLHCEDILFDGQVESEKIINQLYDDAAHLYHVIINVPSAISRKYFCKGCNKGCASGVRHRCQEISNHSMAVSPCS
jgi:hypothetical protein